MNKKTSFKNVDLSWYRQGQGPALVLLHGFAEDHRVWLHSCAALSKRYTVILPDLQASGHSGWPEDGSSMEKMAEAILAVLDYEKIQTAVVIGHSMGGYVALALAEAQPERCAALGLFCSHPFADDEVKRANRDRTIALIREKGHGQFINSFIPGLFASVNLTAMQEVIQTLKTMNLGFSSEAHIVQLQAMRNRPDRSHIIQKWPKALLVVGGIDDPILPYTTVLKAASLAPITVFRGFSGAGHMVHYEKAEKTIALLDEFMKFTLS
jgi:pimeloyl-ACP methyl ester carboxylesterase